VGNFLQAIVRARCSYVSFVAHIAAWYPLGDASSHWNNLFGAGSFLAVAWWSPAFVAALQVLLVVVLLLWGAISTLVGYSALKARREYDESIAQEPVSAAQPSSKAAPASEESAM
jgi:hypothetical protein